MLRDNRSTVRGQGLRESMGREDKVDERREEGKVQQNSGRAKERGWRVAFGTWRTKLIKIRGVLGEFKKLQWCVVGDVCRRRGLGED